MQLLHCYQGFVPSAETQANLSRIETLWDHARTVSGAENGPLFGHYSLADVFYAPVAARIVGYGLGVSAEGRAYCDMLLADPAFLRWRGEALKTTYFPFPYPVYPPITQWPDYEAR